MQIVDSSLLLPLVGWYIALFRWFLTPVGFLSFVDLMSCFCCFICPLSVAGEDSGQYSFTACAVRPSHVTNWLFVHVLMSIFFVGENKHWWRYLMSDSLEVIENALLLDVSVAPLVVADC